MTPSVHRSLPLFLCTVMNQSFVHYVFLTEYLALVASSSPSRSQLIIGFGFPWAEQLSRVLPPSLASTYFGGVDVNEGGAVGRKEMFLPQQFGPFCLKYKQLHNIMREAAVVIVEMLFISEPLTSQRF